MTATHMCTVQNYYNKPTT